MIALCILELALKSPKVEYVTIGSELYGYSNITITKSDKQHHEEDAEHER